MHRLIQFIDILHIAFYAHAPDGRCRRPQPAVCLHLQPVEDIRLCLMTLFVLHVAVCCAHHPPHLFFGIVSFGGLTLFVGKVLLLYLYLLFFEIVLFFVTLSLHATYEQITWAIL